MQPSRLVLSLPASPPDSLEPAVGVFHRFIQRGLVEGFLLDVADYRHVPTGPGVMLIGHDVDYGLSSEAFTVTTKRRDDGAAEQLRDAVRMALGAIEAIDDDGALPTEFDPSRLRIVVPDRRLGDPDQVQQALLVDLQPVVADLFGSDAVLEPVTPADPRDLPEVTVKAVAVDGLLDRLGGSRAPRQGPWDISVRELQQLRESDAAFTLLDVREDTEYETVNIGGTLLPLGELEERLDELDSSAHVVVHCRAGFRGAQAVEQLREAGFDNAWNVTGGLMAWIDHVDPTLPKY